MTTYKDILKDSQLQYVEDIVSQIPEKMGARDAFVNILNVLAEGGAKKSQKYQFFVIDLDEGLAYGTNNEDHAVEVAKSDQFIVIDAKGVIIDGDGDEQSIEEDGE